MDCDALALQSAKVLRIGGNFDGDKLIGPDVMMGTPDFAERPAADLGFQDVFADSLIGCRH